MTTLSALDCTTLRQVDDLINSYNPHPVGSPAWCGGFPDTLIIRPVIAKQIRKLRSKHADNTQLYYRAILCEVKDGE